MRTKLIITAAIIAMIAVVGVAVYGIVTHDRHSPTDQAATTPASAHNAVDVMFSQGMIPHHEGAIEMADLAPSRSTNAEVLALAERIKAAQGPEITQMKGWLAGWNEPATMPGMDHDMAGMDHSSAGMMSDAEMAKLQSSSGADFDRQFLALMITHHQGAVDMAHNEVASGSYPAAIAIAKGIINNQQAEITEMQGLLQKL